MGDLNQWWSAHVPEELEEVSLSRYVSLFVSVCVFCVSLHLSMYIYIYMSLSTYIYIYIYICIYIYIDIDR